MAGIRPENPHPSGRVAKESLGNSMSKLLRNVEVHYCSTALPQSERCRQRIIENPSRILQESHKIPLNPFKSL